MNAVESRTQSDISRVLWAGVVRRAPWCEQIAAAQAAGFDVLTVPPDIYRREIAAGLSSKDMCDIAAEASVTLDLLDGMSAWLPGELPDGVDGFAREALSVPVEECLEICSKLGLKSMVAVGWFGKGDFDLEELSGHFGAFCDRAAEDGVRIDLEFMPMPHAGIRDITMAWDVVRGADRPNGGILLDTGHFIRSGSDLEVLRSIPAGVIADLQLADAKLEPRGADLIEDATLYRLMPGTGELPILEPVRILVEKGGLASIGPEIFYTADGDPEALDGAIAAARTMAKFMGEAGLEIEFASQGSRTRAK